MIDVRAAVRAYLAAQAGIIAQVSTRVYGAPGIPREDALLMPRKALAFYASGGPGADRYVPEAHGNIQFRCYGATSLEAGVVYAALYDALHRKHHIRLTGDMLILTIEESMAPTDMVEPATGWPFVMCVYDVHYVTQTVAEAA